MILDEHSARRAAYIVAGLLLWILYHLVHLAAWPLSILGETYFSGTVFVLLFTATVLCTYYVLRVSQAATLLTALKLAVLWLVVFFVAEYVRHFIVTRETAYPLPELAGLLLATLYIPLGTLACGTAMQLALRRRRN